MPDRNQLLAIQNGLLESLRENRKRIARIAGVHHADVGLKYINNEPTDIICIRLHVYNKNQNNFLKRRAAPLTLDGIPTDVIETTPVFDAFRGDEFSPEIFGGLQIANPHIRSIGTLGCALRHNSGRLVGLTNHHVLFDDLGRVGDSVIQPFRAPADPSLVIGRVIAGNGAFDCAIFEFNNSRPVRESQIAGFDLPIMGMEQPVVNDHVKKCGATTGITFGRVEGVDERGRITIAQRRDRPNPGNKISDLGDSGSLWLLDFEDLSAVVGLHYQGNLAKTNAYAFTIRNVFSSLNIQPLQHINIPIV